MVGKHVAALELQVGAALLQRTTRRQSLTETGQHFYDRCRVILAEANSAYALEEVTSAAPRGRLRLSAPVGFGACWLAPVVGSFLQRHPDVAVELNLTDRFVDIVDEGFDAALRLGPIEETRLAVRDLCPHPQVLCASPSYLAQRGVPATPEDLAEHACLGYINWSGRLFAEWRFGRAGVIFPARILTRFQVNDGRVLVAAAVAGHGIILQPEVVVREALVAGALQPLLTNYVAPTRMLHLVHAAREPQPAKLRVFIDHLLDAIAAKAPM